MNIQNNNRNLFAQELQLVPTLSNPPPSFAVAAPASAPPLQPQWIETNGYRQAPYPVLRQKPVATKQQQQLSHQPTIEDDFQVAVQGTYGGAQYYVTDAILSPRLAQDRGMFSVSAAAESFSDPNSVVAFRQWLRNGGVTLATNIAVPFTKESFDRFPSIYCLLRGNEYQPTILVSHFIEPANVYHLHWLLNQYVYQKSGNHVNLHLQDLQEWALILAGVYDYYRQYERGPTYVQEDLKQMNELVLEAVVPQVLNAIQQQAFWNSRGPDYIPVPMKRPEYVHRRDETKQNMDLSSRYELASVYWNRDMDLWQRSAKTMQPQTVMSPIRCGNYSNLL